MSRVLILGAGMVSKPIVRYLLSKGYEVWVATRTVSKAEALIEGHPRGKAIKCLADDTQKLKELIKESDIVVSLLPHEYHVEVAKICIEEKKNMVTTSYTSSELESLDNLAKESGIIILNEMGFDPGIDHMLTMKMIDGMKEKGFKVTGYYSYCGALPAPECANNPIKYKFSWSPRGALQACKNPARYMRNGEIIEVKGDELFEHRWIIDVEEIGKLEAYPNRDSVKYIEKYGIPGVKNVLRATLRYPGWCETMDLLNKLGLLSEEEYDFGEKTWSSFTKERLRELRINRNQIAVKRLEWLSLFSEEKIGGRKIPLDLIVEKFLSKAQYKEGERDMCVLKIEIEFEKNGSQEKHIATFLEFGEIGNETAVSRAVSLPAAVAVELILKGEIKSRGVRIPVDREIYEPVLNSLDKMGFSFKYKVSARSSTG